MNKLTIVKGNDKWNILIDNFKIIYGNDYNKKFDILRTIKAYFNNFKYSEFAQEHNYQSLIYINDKKIKPKDCLYFNINKYYSIEDDLKMTTKSLILKYLEVIFKNDMLYDTINTLNYLFESLGNELEDISLICGQFTSMVPKQLAKLLIPYYFENDGIKNEYDLSIEEIILFQLQLVKIILDNNKKYDQMIICIELPKLTNNIYKYIQSLDSSYILVFVNSDDCIVKETEKYYLCENNICFDLNSDEELYQYICDNNFKLLSLQEGRDYMEKYLFDREHDKAKFISKLLMK